MPGARRRGITSWIVLVAVMSVAFSLVFACAAPFAALAAYAGALLTRRMAVVLVAAAWAANQLTGFLLLGYPRQWDSVGWGLAIGVAAVVAALVAARLRHAALRPVVALTLSLASASMTYEVILLAAAQVLPSGPDAFSWAVIAYVLRIDALAFAGLLLLHRLAVAGGFTAIDPGVAAPAGSA